MVVWVGGGFEDFPEIELCDTVKLVDNEMNQFSRVIVDIVSFWVELLGGAASFSLSRSISLSSLSLKYYLHIAHAATARQVKWRILYTVHYENWCKF